jgi:hypothetical protein
VIRWRDGEFGYQECDQREEIEFMFKKERVIGRELDIRIIQE